MRLHAVTDILAGYAAVKAANKKRKGENRRIHNTFFLFAPCSHCHAPSPGLHLRDRLAAMADEAKKPVVVMTANSNTGAVHGNSCSRAVLLKCCTFLFSQSVYTAVHKQSTLTCFPAAPRLGVHRLSLGESGGQV